MHLPGVCRAGFTKCRTFHPTFGLQDFLQNDLSTSIPSAHFPDRSHKEKADRAGGRRRCGVRGSGHPTVGSPRKGGEVTLGDNPFFGSPLSTFPELASAHTRSSGSTR